MGIPWAPWRMCKIFKDRKIYSRWKTTALHKSHAPPIAVALAFGCLMALFRYFKGCVI